MQTTVSLQDPYTYTIIPLILTLCLTMASTFYLLLTRKKIDKNEVEKVEIKEIPEKNIKNMVAIKGKYLKQLESIEYKYNQQMIELRKAYQLISEAIRMFVFESTDITTQNYSLAEIKRLNIPNLYELLPPTLPKIFVLNSIQ